jgi:hypothetical protein
LILNSPQYNHSHDYSVTPKNYITFPYILMDDINGAAAFELSAAHGNPMSIPPAYADRYFAQLADIMA